MSNQYNLFDEFPPVSAKQWKQKIQFDLKGADYNKTLLSHTLEGITIKPIYHSDSYRTLEIPDNNTEFQICQTIFINDEKTANFLAKDALNRGADSIRFQTEKPFDIDTVFDGLLGTTLYFQFLFLDLEFILNLINKNKEQPLFLNIDLIGNLVQSGKWFFNNKKDHAILTSIINHKNSNICTLGIDVSLYQNAGANAVQQVAYALAHASEYLNFIDKNKIDSVKKINFSFSTGSNYFFEIAKLRAFKYLWNLICSKYNLEIEASIFSQPSLRNKTLFDFNVNMLRTTSESMSAILGGAGVVSNVSYDTLFRKKNEFGERIARNQLIILKEESKIKNGNLTKGSYYLEDLSFEIAEKALIIFKDIEKSGGFIKQLFEGTIQRKIEENAKKEQQLFDIGEFVLVGTNKYLNIKDQVSNDFEIYPFLKTKKKQTVIQPIIAKRLAEKIEKEHFNKH